MNHSSFPLSRSPISRTTPYAIPIVAIIQLIRYGMEVLGESKDLGKIGMKMLKISST